MRIAEALLPVLELAIEQCRKLAAEPEPVASTPRKRAKKTEPEPEPGKLPALGDAVVRLHIDALRMEERLALRLIRNHGPLTLTGFARLVKWKPQERQRVIEDLNRYGLVAAYIDNRGRAIIHATDVPEPVEDWNAEPGWPRKRQAIVLSE